MQNIEENRLQKIMIELEKRYPFFKKRDIYSTVREAYKKVHAIINNMTVPDFDQVKKIADQDLGLS